jgi:hypothetical protein
VSVGFIYTATILLFQASAQASNFDDKTKPDYVLAILISFLSYFLLEKYNVSAPLLIFMGGIIMIIFK